MNTTQNNPTAPEDVLEWMPSLTLDDNWIASLPTCVGSPVQQIADETGDTVECVMAGILPIVCGLLRRKRLIHDNRGQSVSADISSILIRPEGQPRIQWYDTLSRFMLQKERMEEGLLETFKRGEIKSYEGIDYIPRETILMSELSIMSIETKMQNDDLLNILLYSQSTSLVDQLDRLTKPVKQELTLALQESWEDDYFVPHLKGHHGGINLLSCIDKEEISRVYRSLFGAYKRAPILMIESTSEFKAPNANALSACVNLNLEPWGVSLQNAECITFSDADQQIIDETIRSFEIELMAIPCPVVRQHLSLLTGLFYKCLIVLHLYKKDEDTNIVSAATNLTRALIIKHYESLYKITDGFTAEPILVPDDPEETAQEYKLVAKIAANAPVNRSTLNRNHSNQQREQLSERLARLLREGKITVDANGNYHQGDAVSF